MVSDVQLELRCNQIEIGLMRITDIHFYSRALIVGEPGRLYISA